MEFLKRLFPGAALRHQQAADQLRAYEAAKNHDFRPSAWNDGDLSGNAVTETAAPKLRQYARWLDENSDVAVALLDAMVNGVVGTGINMIPVITDARGNPLEKASEDMLELLQLWLRAPDVTGQLPGGEFQRSLCRSWLRDGEMFGRHVEGNRPGLTGPVPYWVELIESDYCPHELSDPARGIVQGVEVNGWNRPRAYHFHRNHPGDNSGQVTSIGETRRVSVDEVLHLKFTRRVPQFRGVTVFAPIMRRIEDIKDLEDYERISARMQAAFSIAIVRDPALGAFGKVDTNTGQRKFAMKPGAAFHLGPGEDVRMLDAKRPNERLNEYLNHQFQRLAGGSGASASEFTRNFDGTYSSQRQEMVYQETVDGRLRNYFQSISLLPVYRRFATWAVASGAVTVPANLALEQIAGVAFVPPGTPWIDKLKEVQGDALAVEKGFKSTQEVIIARGGNPKQVRREREQWGDDKAAESKPVKPETEDDDEETATPGTGKKGAATG